MGSADGKDRADRVVDCMGRAGNAVDTDQVAVEAAAMEPPVVEAASFRLLKEASTVLLLLRTWDRIEPYLVHYSHRIDRSPDSYRISRLFSRNSPAFPRYCSDLRPKLNQ